VGKGKCTKGKEVYQKKKSRVVRTNRLGTTEGRRIGEKKKKRVIRGREALGVRETCFIKSTGRGRTRVSAGRKWGEQGTES